MLTVIVVGGGLGGVSAAIALARSGHQVTLLEARKEFTELGAGIMMPPNATRILRDWGLLDEVRAKGDSPEFMTFCSYRDGSDLYKLRLSPDLENEFGTPHLTIHRREILRILVQKARDVGVSLKVDCLVVDIDLPNRSVTTANGEVFTADMIIGADGGDRSLCKDKITGHQDQPQPTGKLVYRFAVDLQDVRQDPELRHLVDPSTITCWIGPRSHLITYALPYNGFLNVPLTIPDPVEGRAQFGPRPADLSELESAFGAWDPAIKKLIRKAKSASYWTLLQLPEDNRIWIDSETKRLVLLGDAAHAMTPYLAQGGAQAIEDGAFIGGLFNNEVSLDEIPSRLKLFCEQRQARTLAIRAKAHRAGQALEMEDGPAQESRDQEMRQGKLRENFPMHFADPVYQKWIYGYDIEEAVKATLE